MRQQFYIERYGWRVTVWYLDGTDGSKAEAILDSMVRAGCRGSKLRKAEELLTSGRYNTGLTFSNPESRESVMVIGKSSSAMQCANTMIHERCHLQMQICKNCNIEPLSEEAAYLAGDIGGLMYKFAHVLLCEGCRRKRRLYG